MKRVVGSSITSTAFTLMLFTLFAVLSLLLVLYGARVYGAVVEEMDSSYELRSSLNYVANKLRAADGAGTVSVETADGGEKVLLICDEETNYICMYYYDGALCEQYLSDGAYFEPSAGQRIVELGAFTFAVAEGNALDLEATTAAGESVSMRVSFRTGGGVQ